MDQGQQGDHQYHGAVSRASLASPNIHFYFSYTRHCNANYLKNEILCLSPSRGLDVDLASIVLMIVFKTFLLYIYILALRFKIFLRFFIGFDR